MDNIHRAYLNIGSNILPEKNLPRAVARLAAAGTITATSSVWESQAVGSSGPNFLNICIAMNTTLERDEFRNQIIRPLEDNLGRHRATDKFGPRPIDIDLILWDGEPAKLDNWRNAYTVVPMAELEPDLELPGSKETLAEAGRRLRSGTWIMPRTDITLNLQK